MSWSELATGIRTLVNADTGTGGLRHVTTPLITAFYTNFAPQGATIPYAVLIKVSEAEEKAFASSPRSVMFGVQLSIWTDRDDGMLAGQAIADRFQVVLDRIAPSVSGGWTASQLLRGDSVGPLDEDESLHLVESYDVHMSK